MKKMFACAALASVLMTNGSMAMANEVQVTPDAQVQTTTAVDAASTTAQAPAATQSVAEPTVEATNSAELPDVSLTPDKFFYGLKLWVERLQLMFTFEATSKAEVLEEQAQLRLAEAKTMLEAGDLELAQKAMAEARAKLAEAQKAIGEAAKANKDLSKLSEQVSTDQVKFTNTLIKVMEVAPEEAKAEIEPVVAELLIQVGETTDEANQDDTAQNEADEVVETDVSLTGELKEELKGVQPRMILVLNEMAKAGETTFAEVYSLYKANPGLGNIAKALGLKMGTVQHAAQVEWKLAKANGVLEVELEGMTAAPDETAVVTPVSAETEPEVAAETDAEVVVPVAPGVIELDMKGKDRTDWKRHSDDDDNDDEDDDNDDDHKGSNKDNDKDKDKDHDKRRGMPDEVKAKLLQRFEHSKGKGHGKND